MFSYLNLYVLLCSGFISAKNWNYHDQSSWIQWDNSCGSNQQSPINIDTKLVKPNPLFKLNFYDYDVEYKNLTLSNRGNKVLLKIVPGQNNPWIGGTALKFKYIFDSLQFNWGFNNIKGSEHSLDGNFGAAELHFVHYKQVYHSYANAITQKDGLAIISVVANLNGQNRALNPIIKALPHIFKANSSAPQNSISSFRFLELLPKTVNGFFKYSGSLTVPPCSEIVTWFVAVDTIDISANQISQFRQLSDGVENQRLNNTRRWIQPLNGRVVEVAVREHQTKLSGLFPDWSQIRAIDETEQL